MRALVLHGPGDYRVEPDWTDPRPALGWVLVKVAYAGICGSDLPRFTTTGSYRHPIILGHEFSGTVEAVPTESGEIPGADSALGAIPVSRTATTVAQGARVAVLPLIGCGTCPSCLAGEPFHCVNYRFLGSRDDGGFAELCLVPEANLLPLPDGMDLRAGALVEPVAVALHAMRRSGFVPGETAMVYGAGPIGLMLALWLRAQGASRVALADPRKDSLELARRLGFTELLDPGSGTSTAGAFDRVFEAAGSNQALLSALGSVRDLGSVTVVGRESGDSAIPHALFERFMRKEVDLKGCWGYRAAGDTDLLVRRLSDGTFPADILVTHEAPLAGAPALIAGMSERRIHYCKVLLRIGA
jgi:L-iditol 2-dehydrogenase